jgi:hypothetical protein
MEAGVPTIRLKRNFQPAFFGCLRQATEWQASQDQQQ